MRCEEYGADDAEEAVGWRAYRGDIPKTTKRRPLAAQHAAHALKV
jgi:hypothetical protein